ncbi:MAG: Asp-tRNA(Asn)/Glu-tRNA(Gln) amidotransferase subunit GatA [Bacteriovoracales bacterium]|nr:Asp-tRNA(Asn)/Glu-tRNA(Gln) amidotransferase subunit GatA [Bacteriovoracales bacterium]
MDIFEAHQKLKAKEISPSELTRQCLDKALKSKNNSFISIVEDFAHQCALESEKRIQKNGPQTYLDGIPFSLKDLFITKGIRTTAGSMILANYIPPYDGYVSEKLKKAGGTLIGKTNCDEFGMGSTNENSYFGPVSNPLNRKFVPGGSSGGSAVSVLEGSSFYSMGTDTGGSIRLPANFCGLISLRPSYGRISRYGQIAHSSSLDQCAPLGKSVTDMACLLEALTEYDVRDATNVPLGTMSIAQDVHQTPPEHLKGKKIGVYAPFIDACKPLVKSSLEKALKHCEEAGAKIVTIDLRHLKYAISTYYIISTSEASSNLARFDGIHYGLRESDGQGLEQTYQKSRSRGFGNEVKRRILLGTYSLSAGYYDAYYKKACQMRRLIFDDFQSAFKSCDVIFSPVCASTAFPVDMSQKSPTEMYINDFYTVPIALAGLPGLALPYGKGENDLPTGFQLIGKPFGEKELLKIGRALELTY